MINAEAFSAAAYTSVEEDRIFHLKKDIAAIQVLPCERGEEPKLGMIMQLPEGAQLRTCGAGFNERTVKVHWAEGTYFVFLQDLDGSLSKAAGI
jgi:hypothetical protein